MSLAANSKDKAANAPWLSIVGVGADGMSGLSPAACAAIESAELVAGSARQLALVRPLVRGEVFVWPSPLADGIEQVLARRGRSTCVLASGDPFLYGIGATLSSRVARSEFVCHPAPSSLSLAAARLGWALQDLDIVSLHGRELSTLLRYLVPGRRVLALSWDGQTPSRAARLLAERGYGESALHVLEALGGPGERVLSFRANELADERFDDLNVIALELVAAPGAFVLPARASLCDSAFEHDGQLTKQDVRAITLSALAPFAGGLLWDVGAGSGSIAIEWMLAHPACRAIAIERDAKRAERIRKNALALGVPALEIVHAEAPLGLHGLPRPDVVFIGGGAHDPAVFERCFEALVRGGRLVINAVALSTVARLIELSARHGGVLRRISIESEAPLGSMTGLKPAMPVLQWRLEKP